MNGTIAAPVEPENAWAGHGAVVLDIGDDVGALVVAMPAPTVGREVEIRPVGDPTGHAHLAHVAVVARPVRDGHVPSLVFPELGAGAYELFEKGCPEDVVLRVEVVGGAVTTSHWPASQEDVA